MYNRILKDEILRLSEKWSIISITGPRQSGKTTLCKICFPTYKYINLEEVSARQLVLSDIKGFLLAHKQGLIIDEAQYIPEVFSYLQVVVDQNPSYRYILSGSSDFLLMQNITQSLAGRVAVKRLLPLSLPELYNQMEYTTDQLMFRGFYPAVWGDNKTPFDVYDSYLTTYIQRDVRQIINIKDLNVFQQFITLCAARVGNELNLNALSDEIGISNVTLKQWISVLEASYTAFRLQPYFKNIGKRLVKTPKLYFYDTGLVCFLLGIENDKQLHTHPMRGAIFENMIVVEMLKERFNHGKTNNLLFYRDKSQHEVDIIQESGTASEAFEIKSGQTFRPEWRKNLEYLRKVIGEELNSTTVLYDGDVEVDSQFNALKNFRYYFVSGS